MSPGTLCYLSVRTLGLIRPSIFKAVSCSMCVIHTVYKIGKHVPVHVLHVKSIHFCVYSYGVFYGAQSRLHT